MDDIGLCLPAAKAFNPTPFHQQSSQYKRKAKKATKPGFLEFFAGSGLVAKGLGSYFKAVWANDICEKKAAVYTANHGNKHFYLGSIADVKGADLPDAKLSWASFPCQDLSLAGLTAGIHAERSGLVWQWLRIMDELRERPAVLVAENVTGLISVDGGSHYRLLHEALRSRGYRVGAVVLNAAHWVPQSRPRVFVIAVANGLAIDAALTDDKPNWAHTTALVNAVDGLEGWIWWKMPEPAARKTMLADLIEWDAPCDPKADAKKKIALIAPNHKDRLAATELAVAPGYKRTRNSKQVLELRFDGIAGCLRTAEGGSSRQVVVLKKGKQIDTRLLTVREAARLMGAPDSYKLPGSYNDGYTAMGDAVAVPVARYLGRHILSPLIRALDE
ncbi:MAG: DNA cytosine methyltransferase [Sulfuricella sp.]